MSKRALATLHMLRRGTTYEEELKDQEEQHRKHREEEGQHRKRQEEEDRRREGMRKVKVQRQKR
jgi:hypothetical protein